MIFIVSIFLMTMSSHAAVSCRKLVSESQSDILTIDSNAVSFSNKKLKNHYLKAIDSAKTVAVRIGLEFPTAPIQITIHPNFNFEGSIASAKHRMDLIDITVPYQRTFDIKPFKKSGEWRFYNTHPIRSLSFFYHEIGHKVFQNYFLKRKNSPVAEAVFLEAKSQELAVLINEKASRDSEGKIDVDSVKDLVAEFMKLSDALDKMQEHGSFRLLTAMEELFADLFLVLTTGNPRSMAEEGLVVGPKNTNRSKRTDSPHTHRDFTDIANDINSWKEKYTEDAHDVFGPTRLFLYQNYLRYPLYLNGGGSKPLVQSVLLAIEKFSKVEPSKLEDMTDVEANGILIQSIGDHMGSFKK